MVLYLELTQRGCIDDLYNEFKDQVPKRAVTTPMPAGTFLSMYNPDGTKREQADSVTADIKAQGYMHIVGTLLWLGCADEKNTQQTTSGLPGSRKQI